MPELTATPVELPSDLTLVIANTLVQADKHRTAPRNYNLRVVETRVAAQLLARHLGVKLGPKDTPTFREVSDLHYGGQADSPTEQICRLDELLAAVDVLFQSSANGMAWADVLVALQLDSRAALAALYHPTFAVEADRLQLHKRSRHVVRRIGPGLD